MLSAGRMTSLSGDWRTPVQLRRFLNLEFDFDFDAAPPWGIDETPPPLFDNLRVERDWGLSTFLNPPYGRGLGLWVAKARRQSLLGNTVVCLLPARTDTRWFHDYCLPFGEIRFIKGRLSFLKPDGGQSGRAPFPSMIVVFRGKS